MKTSKTEPINIKEVKGRARVSAVRFLWRLIIAAFSLESLILLMNTVIALLDDAVFGDKYALKLWGVEFSLSTELMTIVSLFILTPITLGVTQYILSIARQTPLKVAAIFEWAGDPVKISAAMKYAVWQAVFSVITFPIGRLSLYALSSNTNLVMEAYESGAQTLDISQFNGYEILIPAAGFFLYLLLLVPFAAIPYIIVDHPKMSIIKAARYSVRVMIKYIGSFFLLVMSFAPWALISSFLILVGIYLVIFFKVSIAVFIDKARANNTRIPFINALRSLEDTEGKK